MLLVVGLSYDFAFFVFLMRIRRGARNRRYDLDLHVSRIAGDNIDNDFLVVWVCCVVGPPNFLLRGMGNRL